MLAGPMWQNVAEYYATKIGEISLFHVTLNHENELEVRFITATENINIINKYLS